ncbi:hypothetical protein [Actinophytocola sp.]|uniref:hypothetical protein n=1 Tax=Actinophytocola sp. TaxID=1872138 RepID=UPI002ED364F6
MIRRIMAALAIAFAATVTLAPVAVADNCDIFINPEDCQNTGWTIGTIATVTGGVAVATVAVMTAQSNQPPTPPTPPPVPPPWTPQQPPRPPRPSRSSRSSKDDEPTIEGVAVRPGFAESTTTVYPEGDPGPAFSLRLVVGRDPGTQTVQEVPHGPH